MLTFCTASAASAAALLAAAAGPVSSGFMAGNNNTSCRTHTQAAKTTNKRNMSMHFDMQGRHPFQAAGATKVLTDPREISADAAHLVEQEHGQQHQHKLNANFPQSWPRHGGYG
jgi:hypothetical protein